MDIGKSFSYVFDDEDWVKKVAIGGVISIIPIVNFIAVGYSLRALKNVAEGKERPLPEWDEWGDDWVKGLMVTLAGFIYAIPLIALSIIGGVVNSLGYKEVWSNKDFLIMARAENEPTRRNPAPESQTPPAEPAP